MCSEDAEHFIHISDALRSGTANLRSLDLQVWSTQPVTRFSIPLGDILRSHFTMTWMRVKQMWRPRDRATYQNLGQALADPNCKLKTLVLQQVGMDIADLGAILCHLSAESNVENIDVECVCSQFGTPQYTESEMDEWLSQLPNVPIRFESLVMRHMDVTGLSRPQLERLLGILSGWPRLKKFLLWGGFRKWTRKNHPGFEEQLNTFMRLNEAGRHYLLDPGASKADGVEVLIKVRDNLNDLYTHLRENPFLCY